MPANFVDSANLPMIQSGAHVTLHYRLSLQEGPVVLDTFGGKPATLEVGGGTLAPMLERLLLGLPEGAESVFDLPPEAAFGPRNPELIQKVAAALIERHAVPGESGTFQPGDVIDFPTSTGGQFAGVFKAWVDEDGERWGLFDFNHPLAGHALRFEVKVIAVLSFDGNHDA